MDLGPIGSYITWDMQFVMGIVSIIVIDLILAGDNAVIIAMAVQGFRRTRGSRELFLELALPFY